MMINNHLIKNVLKAKLNRNQIRKDLLQPRKQCLPKNKNLKKENKGENLKNRRKIKSIKFIRRMIKKLRKNQIQRESMIVKARARVKQMKRGAQGRVMPKRRKIEIVRPQGKANKEVQVRSQEDNL